MNVNLLRVLIFLAITHQALAQNDFCESFLARQNLDLSTSLGFNSGLSGIADASDYKKFILKLNQFRYSQRDKQSFVRSGLYELQNMSTEYLQDIDPITVEILLRFMSKAGKIELTSEFAHNVEVHYLSNLSALEARNISAVIYLFGRLRVKPSDAFLEVIQNEFIKKIDTFNPQNLSNIVFGFGSMGILPKDSFFKSWRERFEVIHADFLPLNIVNSLFAFYLMGSIENVIWYVNAVPNDYWESVLKKSEIRQVAQVFEYYERVLNIVLKPLLKFKDQFRKLIEKPINSQSDFEKKFELALALSGRDYEVEYKTIPGFYVDFYIPEINRIIQIDGPSHFVRELQEGLWLERQRPHDRLIDQILKTYGYDVQRKSYREL